MAYSANNLLDIILKDDNTGKGGVPHNEYSAWEFIGETGILSDHRILSHEEFDKLNRALTEEGIRPLTSEHYDIETVKSHDGFIRLKRCNEPTVDWNL